MSTWFYALALLASAVSLLTFDPIALGIGLISALLGMMMEDLR